MANSIIPDDPLFPVLSPPDLACLMDYGTEVDLAAGDVIFRQGEVATSFFVILEGQVRAAKKVGDDTITLRVHEPGEFTGEITSLVVAEPQIATGTALGAAKVLQIPVESFRQMLVQCPQIRTAVLPALIRRGPEAAALTQQREKMASLGVLAAGLAHELNNPAAAAKRSSAQLKESVEKQMHLTLVLAQSGEMVQDCVYLRDFRTRAMDRAYCSEHLDTLTRSDREDEIMEWLDAKGVPESYDLPPTLVDSSVTIADLDDLCKHFSDAVLPDTVRWLACSLTVGSLINEVEKSSTRISELVRAVKDYSYMDQAPLQEIDLTDGIENTLTILSYKIRHGEIKIVRDYAPNLPRLTAYGSELNQVWTNLLDNALDAVDGKGTITIKARAESDHVTVEIGDDGPGIPAEIRTRVFDPFFTTKGVGKGTGLGLETSYRIAVQRHHGDLRFESRPGNTRFIVTLPTHLGETAIAGTTSLDTSRLALTA